MDAVRRANFASRQVRAGPAPLASFEDLPSDELESPEDFAEIPIRASSVLGDDYSDTDLQLTTPDSLTISSQSTPRIECDLDSNFTITPGDSCDGQSTSELRTTSLSSLSTLNVKQKKGSNVSLGTAEASDSSDFNQRKSSWTKIFRGSGQNSAKSSVSASSSDHSPDKSVKKKSKKSLTDSKQPKEKGKFLSLFKKKSSKDATSPLSPGESAVSPSENLNTVPELKQAISVEASSLPLVVNGNITNETERVLQVEEETSSSIEVQNDLGKVFPESIEKCPDERKINRKLINISADDSLEKEYNILSNQVEEKQVDKASKTENIKAIVGNDESDSELALEDKESLEEKESPEKKDEIEAENLLLQDEMDEDSIIEIQPKTIEVSKQTLIPSRQQRLEVTTKPIDRPRSTTPINVASLEAFIQSVSPTFVAKVEKIKLSLPGEQFIGRVKSPKKSTVKSWTDFCERGLHSPRMIQRTDSDNQDDPFGDGATFPSDPNWAEFGSSFGSNGFGDDFTDLANTDNQLLKDPYQSFETNFSVISCSCVCHAKACNESNRQSAVSLTEKCCECDSNYQPNSLHEVDGSPVRNEGLKCDSVFQLQNRQVL